MGQSSELPKPGGLHEAACCPASMAVQELTGPSIDPGMYHNLYIAMGTDTGHSCAWGAARKHKDVAC